MKKLKIKIDNLKCEGCEGTIRRGMLTIGGIEKVEFDHDDKSVVLHYLGIENLHQYHAKLAKLGYPRRGSSSQYQKAKSYVSCAIGKLSK